MPLSRPDLHLPAGGRPALEAVSLDIEPGTLGVSGRTGSGKSTLCKLLLRMYPVANNTLSFAAWTSTGWTRHNCAPRGLCRPREPVLFAGTIADNIALGRPDAPRAEIEAAARAAAIDAEIQGFTGGYQAGDR